MMMPAGPPISNHLPFPGFGGYTGFQPNSGPIMQMMVPTHGGIVPQQQGSYAIMPNMLQQQVPYYTAMPNMPQPFHQFAPPPVNGLLPQFQQMQHQRIMYGEYNFGAMVPFQHQQQFRQGGGPALMPTPIPLASLPVAPDGMVYASQAEIPAMTHSWRNSSVDDPSCPTSPDTSSESDGDGSSSAQLSFDSTSDDTTGMPPQYPMQPIMYSANFNGEYNFGAMVSFQHPHQFNQSFGGAGFMPTPIPLLPVAPDGMAFGSPEMYTMPHPWRNSSLEALSCPTSPYTSTDSDGSSSAQYSLGSTSADDSSSVSSTGMSPPQRHRFKRSQQPRIGGPMFQPIPCITDFTTTFVMDGEELPYVLSVWDPTRPMKFLRPPPDLAYYVPPAVDDGDFFGGQQHLWQAKMVQYFARYQPDLWKLQAVPDFHRDPADGWLGFNVTSKLRFCCRTCNTPWTSKQGKIVFGFTKDVTTNRGWIFMKIFGQICMKKQIKQCQDWKYQQPACYPEEIERAVLKLSDFIGYQYYRMPMKSTIFEECKKSIRIAVGRSNGCNTAVTTIENHHRKDLCQACIQGVCRQKVNPAGIC